jgi:hypothetical protein
MKNPHLTVLEELVARGRGLPQNEALIDDGGSAVWWRGRTLGLLAAMRTVPLWAGKLGWSADPKYGWQGIVASLALMLSVLLGATAASFVWVHVSTPKDKS